MLRRLTLPPVGSRWLALFAAVTLFPLAACDGPRRQVAKDPRPNIIVLVADDHRADVLGSAGHPHIQTPALDRLAAEGVRFTEAFSTNGVCAPARASLLTGKTSAGHGVSSIISGGVWNTFKRQERSFPARLHDAGYYAVHIGKWHLGENHKPQPGYDRFIGTDDLQYFGTRWWIHGGPKIKPLPRGHVDLVMAQLAAHEIDRLADQEAPFALYVAFKGPHEPFKSSAERQDDLAEVTIEPPPTFANNTGLGARGPAIDGPRGYQSFGSYDAFAKAYFRTIHTLDDAVGIVLEALDRNALSEDTLVIYTSDQGLALGERGTTGKQYAHEQTMRVPLLVRYPREIRAGVVDDRAMALITDVAPTVLDYAGVGPSEDQTGRSLRPLIAGTATDWRDDFLFEYWYFRSRGRRPAHLALRTADHKLVRYEQKKKSALYDLEADPFELIDHSDDPAYAAILADLESRLDRQIARTGWQPRVQVHVDRLIALGPLPGRPYALRLARQLGPGAPADFDQVYEVGGGERRWREVEIGDDRTFDLTAMADADGDGAADGPLLLGLEIRRKTERDPAILVRFTNASGPVVLVGDEDTDPWVFQPGDSPRHWSDRVTNPALGPGDSMLWLIADPATGSATLELAVVAPKGSIELP